MSVYDDILAWSSTLPTWQRDALRRLVTSEDLTPEDLVELTTLCFRESAGRHIDTTPLAPAHMPAGGGTDDVVLLGIDSVQNNALSTEGAVVFGRTGLHAVYGDNGSGKSGYVRVLKQVCRSRDAAAPVLPNVFSENRQEVQGCRIQYAIGTEDHEFQWCPGVEGPDALSWVSIFDSGSASVYVNEEGAVAFSPLGLDLLDHLASVVTSVGARLKSRREGLISQMPTVPPQFAVTAAGRWVISLAHDTPIEDVRRQTTLEGADAERLVSIKRTLQEPTPRQGAQQLRARAQRIERYEDQLKAVASGISPARIQEMTQARTTEQALAQALAVVSEDRFESEPLAGVGSDSWRVLWEAAKGFAEAQAYPDFEYPEGPWPTMCALPPGAFRRSRCSLGPVS